MKCLWHLCDREAKKKLCSSQCKNKFHVAKRRRQLKRKAVEYKGGECQRCEYDKCIGALEFDHEDPFKKDFSVSYKGHTKSWERSNKNLTSVRCSVPTVIEKSTILILCSTMVVRCPVKAMVVGSSPARGAKERK